MSRTEIIVNSFTGGELSPNVLGRTDLAKYHNGMEKCSNFIVKYQGGISRRFGSRYITDATGPSRLIPFIINATQSYILEFGNQTLRFYVNDGQIQFPLSPPIVTTPNWNTVVGGTTIDGTVTWTMRGPGINQAQNQTSPTAWKPLVVYILGNIIADSQGFIWQVTTAGTSAGFRPDFEDSDQSIGTTLADGTVVWTNIGRPVWVQNTAYALNNVIIDSNSNVQQVTTAGTSMISTIISNIPYQIPTPYNTATDDLWDIKFVQLASVMYLVHPNHPPMKLIRVSDTNWSLIQPLFYAAPATKQDQDISGGSISITVLGPVVTASSGVFIGGDVGKAIIAGTGKGYISALSGSSGSDPVTGSALFTTATITVTNPFDTTSYTAGNWKLRGGPLAYFSPGSWSGTVAQQWSGARKFAFGKPLKVLATTDHPTDKSWTTISGSSTVFVKYTAGFTDSFRSIDIGSYVPFAGGYGLITGLGPAPQGGHISQGCSIIVLSVPTVIENDAWGGPLIAPTPPGGWSLETPEFGGTNFPRAITLFGDRLYLASTPNNPQTFWGSNVGDYENFALGTLDADGIRFTINSGILDQILWMLPYGGGIVAGTLLDEYIVNGGAGQQVVSSGAPITPSNINVIRQSSFGNSRIQPLVVDNDLIYVQRSQQKAYEFSFNPLTSSFGSRDLNLLNEIITTTAFKEMAFQKSPNKTIWFTDNSGNLVGLTYQKDQDVWAWHRHFTGVDGPDSYISIANIPTSSTEIGSGTALINQDELWMVCKRIRNGVYVYTIEQFDIGFSGYVDSASFNVFANPVTSISGLGYLQGRTVFVVADGAILPSVVMGAAGTYTFPPGFSAKNVQAGLNYISDMITVRPEPKTTVQGLIKRWAKLWIRIYQSLFIKINNQVIPFNLTSTPLAQATPLFTGDVNVNNLGRDRDGRIEVTQTNPLPCNLLAIFGNLEISDGI